MREEIPVYKFALREDLQDHPEFLPTKADPEATGWDVKCAEPDGVVLYPFQKAKIRLGFRGFCPPGYWYKLVPRSSSFAKKDLHALYGTIDETFSLECMFACKYIPDTHYLSTTYSVHAVEAWESYCNSQKLQIDFGEAIGQIIPVKRQEMNVEIISNAEFNRLDLERNAARKGGFGSSDNK